MNELYLGLAIIGGLVLGLGVFSDPIKNRLPVSGPLIALLLGIVLGPVGLDLLDPARWGDEAVILEEAARLTLAIGLMAVALRLPPGHFIDQWQPSAVLIGLVMPIMWVSTTLLVYFILEIPPLIALLIGAVLTPIDPIVSSSILTSASAKEHLPDRVRHNLSGESGANDGLAYLFVLLPILLLTDPAGGAVRHWFLTGLLREVGGGAVLGAVFGIGAGKLLRFGERNDFIEKTSFLAYTAAFALLTIGTAKLLATDGVLAVFVGGIAFDSVVGGTERAEEADIQEAVNQFFSLPIFALIGLAVPFDQWLQLGWRGLAVCGAILAFRRLPAVLALRSWMPPIDRRIDAWFIGWFGPMGVSAFLYAMMAMRRAENEFVWTVSSLVICASVAAHGITATPLTWRYAEQSDQ